jgi:hypothetical protein
MNREAQELFGSCDRSGDFINVDEVPAASADHHSSSMQPRAVRALLSRIGLGGCLLVGAAAGPVFVSAAPASAAGACVASPGGVAAHLTTVFSGSVPSGVAVSGLSISGLDPATCDGSIVQLKLLGNATGDPKLPATTTLAAVDSSLDPCTGVLLAIQVEVQAGAIPIGLCAIGGPSGYVDLVQLTEMDLSVAGVSVPVGPIIPSTPILPGAPTQTGTSPTGSGSTGTGTTGTASGAPGTPTSGAGLGSSSSPPTTAPTQVLGETITRPPAGTSTEPTGSLAFTGNNLLSMTLAALLLTVVGAYLKGIGSRRGRRRSTNHR